MKKVKLITDRNTNRIKLPLTHWIKQNTLILQIKKEIKQTTQT